MDGQSSNTEGKEYIYKEWALIFLDSYTSASYTGQPFSALGKAGEMECSPRGLPLDSQCPDMKEK